MDNKRVKKVMTFKSGKFVFSHNFALDKVAYLEVEVRTLNQAIVDLPILPHLASQLDEELMRRSVHGTAAIEGNPLSEEEVGEVLDRKTGAEGLKPAEREVVNLKNIYDVIKDMPPISSQKKLSEELIKSLHHDITDGIEHEHNVPGDYRNNLVKVGDVAHGGVYTPPKILEDIKSLMTDFISWVNGGELLGVLPPVRAALVHYHLGLIHPFADGNGRTARFVEAMILHNAGYKFTPKPLANFYQRNIDDYFWAFSNARKDKEHDVTPFVEFVLKGLIESLNEVKGRITYFIRKFTVHNYYDFLVNGRKITKRQHDLLLLLLDDGRIFKLPDLFSGPPFSLLYNGVTERTARRDLKRLLDGELLKKGEGNAYELNLHVMG